MRKEYTVRNVLLFVLLTTALSYSAKHYFKESAGGANNGANIVDAFESLDSSQTAAAVNTGDTCICIGTFNDSLSINSKAGIIYIGGNGSGEIDGARFLIDAQGIRNHCITNMTVNSCRFYNMECANALQSCINFTTGDYYTFYNCYIHDADSCGFRGTNGASYVNIDSCLIRNCAVAGVFLVGYNTNIYGTTIKDCYHGIDQQNSSILVINSIIDSSRATGMVASGSYVIKSVFVGRGVAADTGFYSSNNGNAIFDCRFGNLSVAYDNGNDYNILSENSFGFNTADTIRTGNLRTIMASALVQSNSFGNADPGFVDTTASDYSTAIGAPKDTVTYFLPGY